MIGKSRRIPCAAFKNVNQANQTVSSLLRCHLSVFLCRYVPHTHYEKQETISINVHTNNVWKTLA